jgi:hypothetical protein
MNRNTLCAGILAAALAGAMAPALAADNLPAELAACREQRDEAQRLACYDREVARLAKDASAAAPAVAAAAPSPEDRFGNRESVQEELSRKRQETRSPEGIEATVTAMEARADGLLTMTLDNGQVWRQIRPDPFFRVKVGEPVKIKPAVLGSFLMSGPSKRSTRVTRVR